MSVLRTLPATVLALALAQVLVLVLVLGLLLAQPACATVIYRWVDESGRTHVSDVVPEKYRKSATRIDSAGSDVSAVQAREARELAAREKALADAPGKRAQRQQSAQPASAASAATSPKRPAQGVTDTTDCSTWRRLYQESEECFGPYRTVGGGVKQEAFERCNVIPSPELKCGPIRE